MSVIPECVMKMIASQLIFTINKLILFNNLFRMKLIGLIFLVCFGLQAQILKLDHNFGLNGIVSFDQINWSSDIVNPAILKFDDNFYLVHGIRNAPKPNQLTLVKFDTLGKLDLSYFNQGINILSFNLDTIGDYKTKLSSLVFYSSGTNEIIASCNVQHLTTKKNAQLLFKLNLSGQIDSSFGNKGSLIIFHDNIKSSFSSELSINSFEQIYFLNYYLDSIHSKYHIDISKFQENGNIDSGFATNGIISIDLLGPSNTPKIFLDGNSNLYISYSNINDSITFVSAYASNGSKLNNFGINNLLQFNTLFGQNQLYFKNIYFHEEFIYLCSSYGNNTGLTIVKIDKNGILDNSFGKAGFLHIDESDNNAYSVHAFDKYLVCFRPNDIKPLQSLILNYNGTPCCGNILEWKLSFDSIPLRINDDFISYYDEELYFIAKSRAPGANPRNLMLFNFKLDLTTDTEGTEIDEIRCFPNPFSSSIQIKDPQSSWPYLIVVDGLGRVLFKKEFKTESDRFIETGNWKTGLYTFILQNNKDQRQTIFKRICVQN